MSMVGHYCGLAIQCGYGIVIIKTNTCSKPVVDKKKKKN